MYLDFLIKLIDLYSILIFISIILSWVDRYGDNQFTIIVRKFTDPFLNLFKIIIPLGDLKLDISPVIALYILDLLKKGIFYLY